MGYEHIDVDGIRRLTRDLVGDIRSCLRFVDDFLASWRGRIDRVASAVPCGDIDDALASLLSIASSGRMVGAELLSILARDLHDEVTHTRTIPPHGLERLARTGAASCDELRHLTALWRVAA